MISIIAHRGYSSRFRENSPLSWREAANAGANFVEVDIRFTADGHCVCMHDPDLTRLAHRPERIEDLNLLVLEGIEADGHRVAPAFSEALDAVPMHVGLLLDVKDERPEALTSLSRLIHAAGERRIMLGLHTLEAVKTMKAAGHNDILGLLADPDSDDAFFEAGGTVFRLWEEDASRERVARLRAKMRPIWVTTGGRGTVRATGDHDRLTLRAMVVRGVTGFLVNDPVDARQVLANAETAA